MPATTAAATGPPQPVPISRREVALGVGLFATWCLVFNIGNGVGAAPFFSALNEVTRPSSAKILPFFMVALTYTPTNTFLLACLSGWVGCFYRRLEGRSAGDEPAGPLWRRYTLAVVGSFMVYLVILSGALTIAGIPFALPEVTNTEAVERAQEKYRIIACFCSLFGMIEGCRPFVVRSIAGRIQSIAAPPGREAAPESTRPGPGDAPPA